MFEPVAELSVALQYKKKLVGWLQKGKSFFFIIVHVHWHFFEQRIKYSLAMRYILIFIMLSLLIFCDNQDNIWIDSSCNSNKVNQIFVYV